MSKLAIVVLCCLAGALAVPTKNQRIIGGTVATPGQFPSIVSIQADGEHLCGGSILSKTTILTAAACFFTPELVDEYTVIVGTHDLSEGGVVHSIDGYVSHPEFDDYTTSNDIAIVKLKEPIEFNENAQPIKLAKDETEREITVVGYGEQSFLKYLKVPLINSRTCAEVYANVYPNVVIDDGKFCTVAPKDEGGCFGDGGSPALNDAGEQFGIFSFACVPCPSGFPEIYTSISAYKDWISSV